MIKRIREIVKVYRLGVRYLSDSYHLHGENKIMEENNKNPFRSEIINFLLNSFKHKETNYLEIGVRDPDDNFNRINADVKYSVDPGIEYELNPVDFKITSDVFFDQVREGKILTRNVKFDVIFIDGLHLAEQVENDIKNALDFIAEDGFIVLHDCNPPTEFNASESHGYKLSPGKGYWNGTTWKAFFKYRQNQEIYSCCIDTDWGVGIISKKINLGKATTVHNPFFEFNTLDKNRKESLNLISYESFKEVINSNIAL